MEDCQIIDLYWARSETAIAETDKKYGRYCHSIAYRILFDEEDSRECVNDTWLAAWDSMPPQRPSRLAAWLGRITRNLSLNRRKAQRADKRGGGELPLALDELADCIPAGNDPAGAADELVLKETLTRFLTGLSAENRRIFLQRYWYFCSVKEIAKDLGLTESKVKQCLFRARAALKALLQQEGFIL